MRVYLDYHSTTPVDRRVVDAMVPVFTTRFGNPSAVHSVGEDAREEVEEARDSVAKLINAPSDAIYFMSGATEANNIALRSATCLADRLGKRVSKPMVITTNSEHSSVRNTLNDLFLKDQIALHYLKIDNKGNIDFDELEGVLSANENVVLTSIIAANNEIGTIHDLQAIGNLCRQYGVLFHTDATQAVGKTHIDVVKMKIDALSMSGHKIYGPKGIGALYLKDKDLFSCMTTGGKQEKVTSGTVNVPGVVGLARACELMLEESSEADRIAELRSRFFASLTIRVDGGITINGSMTNRLYNNLNITIKDVPAEVLVLGLDDICISTGSACTSRSPKPSHVVTALGLDNPECALRISFGRWTTEEEVEYAARRIAQVVNKVRENNV